MTGITLQDGVSEINKYFQKYCRPSKVRNASLISQHSVMIKADPSDVKDDSSCDKALRHLKQLVQDMACMELAGLFGVVGLFPHHPRLLPSYFSTQKLKFCGEYVSVYCAYIYVPEHPDFLQ